MIRFSIIIPVYNRPQEIRELLESLSEISREDLEILIIDDGSEFNCREVAEEFSTNLPVQYFFKENTGQGFTRNWATERANGEYLVFFDSDCLIPADYFDKAVKYIDDSNPDAWGGPDRAHSSFTDFQKAVAFTMSSILTTGGIRGKKGHIGKFQPRTFNMGIKKAVFQKLGGFTQTNLGEDIELSSRLIASGYKSMLFEDCFVYHKRRETLGQFIRQASSFGKGRVLNSRRNSGALKLVHLLPIFFVLGFISIPFWNLVHPYLFLAAFGTYLLYFILAALLAIIEYRSLIVGILAMPIAFIQLASYAGGMLAEFLSGNK